MKPYVTKQKGVGGYKVKNKFLDGQSLTKS